MRTGPKKLNRSPAYHTLPHLQEIYRMSIMDISIFRTHSAAVVLATVLASLVPRPSLAPVFDRLQYAKLSHSKRSKTRAGEGLGMRNEARSLPLFSQMKHILLQTTFECLFSCYNILYNYVIIASFYIFYASSVDLTILLLRKPSN